MDDAKRIEDEYEPSGRVNSSIRDKNDDSLDDLPEAKRDTVVVESFDDDEAFRLRAYQDEMLAESIKRNTIVVLNTGAGKTHM